MRLPYEKIYRAFPELDPFSDDECQRYLLQVRAQKRIGLWPYASGCGLALLLAFVILPALGFAFRNVRLRIRSDELRTATFVLVMALFFGLPLLTGLFTRDRLLRRALRDRIENARCTRCRHSLLGLPLLPQETPAVICPECGAHLRLADQGLTPEDLMPRPSPPAP